MSHMCSVIETLTLNGENEEFFVKEHSTLTLLKLIKEYNVMGFNSIEIPHYERGDKKIDYLFRIKEISKEKMIEAKKFLEEIDLSKYGQIKRNTHIKKEIIQKFGKKYLITEGIEKGPTFIQIGRGPTNNETKSIENYFVTRITKIDKEKEKNLGDLKTYSTLLLERGLEDLELEKLILFG